MSCCTKRYDRKRLVQAFLLCLVTILLLIALNGCIFTEGSRSIRVNKKQQKDYDQVGVHKKSYIESERHFAVANRSGDGFGYILVSHYSDQMTGASLNLLSLQCWAGTLSQKVKVVEPFLFPGGSKFGTSLASQDSSANGTAELVRLRDMMDIQSWLRETDKLGFSPLVSWKQFLESAPENLIAVRRKCEDSSNHKCRYTEAKFNSSLIEFSKLYKFKTVRFVYLTLKSYTSVGFRNLIYGDHKVNSAVVLFSHWGGIYSSPEPKSFRIGIPEAKACHRHLFVSFPFRHSKLVQKDSEVYLEKYLTGYREKGYISVMFRSERFALNHAFHKIESAEVKMSLLVNCVKDIVAHVNSLKRQSGIEAVFLAMDCRKQGSKVFRQQTLPKYIMNTDMFDKVALTLFQSLFGNSSSLRMWDESFDSISTFKSAGYLAQLQKYLASHATCLLTAGGGGFQLSAVKLYNESRSQSSVLPHCAMNIPQCL